jgi:hypothetical protein
MTNLLKFTTHTEGRNNTAENVPAENAKTQLCRKRNHNRTERNLNRTRLHHAQGSAEKHANKATKYNLE